MTTDKSGATPTTSPAPLDLDALERGMRHIEQCSLGTVGGIATCTDIAHGSDFLRTTLALIYEGKRLRDERDAAIGHLTAVLDKWDEVLPFVQSVEGIALVHGWRYTGPEGGMPVVTDPARTFLESVREKRG